MRETEVAQRKTALYYIKVILLAVLLLALISLPCFILFGFRRDLLQALVILGIGSLIFALISTRIVLGKSL